MFFFPPFYPLCTFLRWALCANLRIQTSSLAKTALFSGVAGRLWSAEPSTCQAAEERKEKLRFELAHRVISSFARNPHGSLDRLWTGATSLLSAIYALVQTSTCTLPKKTRHDALMRQWLATPTRPSYPSSLPYQHVLEYSQNHRLLYLHPLAPSFIIILLSLHERCSFGRPAVITVIHVYDSRHWKASTVGFFSSDKLNEAPQASVQMKCRKTVSHFAGRKNHKVN